MKSFLAAGMLTVLFSACSADAEVSASVGTKVSPGASGAASVASATTAELSDITRTVFQELSAALAGITDVSSAVHAKPALVKLAETSVGVAARRAELAAGGSSAEAKRQLVKEMLQLRPEMEAIGGHFARIEHVPGVREELEGVMSKISASFTPRQPKR